MMLSSYELGILLDSRFQKPIRRCITPKIVLSPGLCGLFQLMVYHSHPPLSANSYSAHASRLSSDVGQSTHLRLSVKAAQRYHEEASLAYNLRETTGRASSIAMYDEGVHMYRENRSAEVRDRYRKHANT
jgi:hypothetical protein